MARSTAVIIVAASLLLGSSCLMGQQSSPSDERYIVEADCKRLLADYAIYRDRADERLADLFTPDGVLVLSKGLGTLNGRDEIRQRIATRPKPIESHLMMITTTKISIVDAETATGVSYVLLLHEAKPRNEGPYPKSGFTAVYEFHNVFKLTDEGWKIARHELVPIFREPA